MNPKINFITFQKEKKKEFEALTEELKEKVKKIIKNKEQAIFFINRKALATTVLCQECGFIFQCPNCEVPLVLHHFPQERKLICHHCGQIQPAPSFCPSCRSHKLKSLGIGTERVALEIKKFDPSLKIQLLFSEENCVKIIEDFNQNKYQFLVATEAIFKPQVKKTPYIIVLSIDNLLFLPDYKSEERAFLILKKLLSLTQKELIIQTINSSNRIFKYLPLKNEEFFKEEMKWRKKHLLPPYCQIIKIIFESLSLKKALEQAQKAQKIIEKKIFQQNLENKFFISSPVPAFILKEKKKFRFYLFLKMKYENPPLENLSFNYGLDILSPLPEPEELKLRNFLLEGLDKKFKINIDPEDLL